MFQIANQADLSQNKLLNSFQQYMELKKQKMRSEEERAQCKLPFDSIEGLCFGLVAYWLYTKRMAMEQKFAHLLQDIVNWNSDSFASSEALIDPRMEEVIGLLAFLQHDTTLRPSVNQNDLAASFALLLDDLAPQISKPELKLSFIFNQQTLEQLLQEQLYHNKMMRIDNVFHAAGIMYVDDKYCYYDPNSLAGPEIFNKPENLAARIFEDLTPWCESKKYLGLNITTYDLEGYPVAKHPPAIDLYQHWLKDPKVKQAFVRHRTILRLGLRSDDFAMLDMLFAANYKYIPWTYNKTTELNEAVVTANERKLSYLINHDIPVNYKTKDGNTALGMAIIHQQPKLLYLLLLAGADPYIKQSIQQAKDLTTMQLATSRKNTEAIILLLAYGYNLSAEESEFLHIQYKTVELDTIIEHALQVNAKLFNSSTQLHINATSGERDLEVAYDAKLKQHLSDFSLDPNNLPFKDLQEIDQFMHKIVNKIRTIDFTLISRAELAEIGVIMEHLTELAKHNFSLRHFTRYLSHAAVTTKKSINDFMRSNGINKIELHYKTNRLLFSTHNKQSLPSVEFESIIPYLSLNIS
jgi:hypothetical protein